MKVKHRRVIRRDAPARCGAGGVHGIRSSHFACIRTVQPDSSVCHEIKLADSHFLISKI